LSKEFSVILLGTRGTMPVSDNQFREFGGDTPCVLVNMGETQIILDAGTGITKARRYLESSVHECNVIISHPHLDHILGLPCFSPMHDARYNINIYGATYNGRDVEEQVTTFMQPPLWPVSPDDYKAKISFIEVSGEFMIGDVKVGVIPGNHPGGCHVYKLSKNGKTFVYATDFEHGKSASARLAEFSMNCDILVYDASYSEAEYEYRVGWGHSTWNEGILMSKHCGAGKVILFHHDFTRSDKELFELEAEFPANAKNVTFGRCGDTIEF
jgi:ribonuclease BN (tRNA processing enzyme)